VGVSGFMDMVPPVFVACRPFLHVNYGSQEFEEETARKRMG
jgi:hypothetical protein